MSLTDLRVPELTRIEAQWPHAWSLQASLLLVANVGSISHGTQLADSDPAHVDDVDLMLISVPPRRTMLGLQAFDNWRWPDSEEQRVFAQELDVVVYSVRKLAQLLLKGNPNVIGLLFQPESRILMQAGIWQQWVQQRDIFMSQRVLHSFSGYAADQLSRLGKPNSRGYMGRERKELFLKHGYDPKNAAHCVRLLRMGIELREYGELFVDRRLIDAEELKSIKRGEWSLTQIQKEATVLRRKFEALRELSTLPAEPDQRRAEDLLLSTIGYFWEA